MKSIRLAAPMFILLASASVFAQESPSSDHDALRKIKTDVLNAINTRNLAGMDKVLHKPAMVTVITQEAFTDAGALQTYYDGLFTRKLVRIGKINIEADADELSQIYTGTFAVARGSTQEAYELADGRHFDLHGRWTATAIKEDGQWKLLAIHSGINFINNPVITAVEKSTAYFGAGGLALGLVLGFGLSLLIRRKRA
jgi:ketosteroid isomerase-like protein